MPDTKACNTLPVRMFALQFPRLNSNPLLKPSPFAFRTKGQNHLSILKNPFHIFHSHAHSTFLSEPSFCILRTTIPTHPLPSTNSNASLLCAHSNRSCQQRRPHVLYSRNCVLTSNCDAFLSNGRTQVKPEHSSACFLFPTSTVDIKNHRPL